ERLGRRTEGRSEPRLSLQRREVRELARAPDGHHRRELPADDRRRRLLRLHHADAAERRRRVKTVRENRAEDLLPAPRSAADGAALWIDDATGKIVDRSLLPKCHTGFGAVRMPAPVASRRRTPEASRTFVDLVGPRPPLTIEDSLRVERTPFRLRFI